MRILLGFTMISLPSFKTKGLRKYIQKYPGGDFLLGCVYIYCLLGLIGASQQLSVYELAGQYAHPLLCSDYSYTMINLSIHNAYVTMHYT